MRSTSIHSGEPTIVASLPPPNQMPNPLFTARMLLMTPIKGLCRESRRRLYLSIQASSTSNQRFPRLSVLPERHYRDHGCLAQQHSKDTSILDRPYTSDQKTHTSQQGGSQIALESLRACQLNKESKVCRLALSRMHHYVRKSVRGRRIAPVLARCISV